MKLPINYIKAATVFFPQIMKSNNGVIQLGLFNVEYYHISKPFRCVNKADAKQKFIKFMDAQLEEGKINVVEVEATKFEYNGYKQSAFTLIELLAVIGIIALICAFVIPYLRNFRVNQTVSPVQLQQDLNYAHQQTIEQRKDVYMLFCNTNYPSTNIQDIYLSSNCLPYQSYCVVSIGKAGEQVGQYQWHQLTEWRNLPSQMFLSPQTLNGELMSLSQWTQDYPNQPTNIPPLNTISIGDYSFPSIPFGGTHGELTTTNDVYLPVVYGSSVEHIDPNSTNGVYDVIRVDRLTGLSSIQEPHVK